MFSIFTQALKRWWNADPSTNGAAIAYYSIFSLAPMILIFVIILGKFFGADAVHGKLNSVIQGFVGSDISHLLNALTSFAYDPGTNIIVSIISSIVIIIGALALFTQVQYALSSIWKNEKEEFIPRTFLRSRIVAVFMVIVLGGILVATFILSALGTVLTHRLNPSLVALGSAINIGNALVSSLYILVLFTVMYKYLPHRKVSLKAAFVGAIVGGALFILGRFLLGFYITAHVLASVYGAAGAIILILVWFYYSAQIFFYGAAIAYVVDQKLKLRQTS
jgi:membrane protein